jgi:hypothetical protein
MKKGGSSTHTRKKRFSILTFFSLIFLFISACGPNSDKAIQYNDKLIAIQDSVVPKEEAFMNSLDSNAGWIQQTHEQLLKQVNLSINATERLGAFEGKKEYASTATTFLTTYKNVVENEYRNMMRIASKDLEDISIADDSLYSLSLKNASAKIMQATEALVNAQKTFAQEYKFQLEDRVVH